MAFRPIIESMPKVALIVAAIAGATASRAQAPAQPAQPVQEPHWTVDHGEVYCTLGRDNGPDATLFTIRVIPGTGQVELLLTNRSWRQTPLSYGQAATIVMTPGEHEPREVDAVTGRLPSGSRLLAFLRLDDSFVASLAKAPRLQLIRGRRPILSVDFPTAKRAVERLRECVDRRLGEWGIDMAGRARLRSLPGLLNVPFSNSDYPSAALRRNAQGMVIARIDVGVDGRVADCAVVRSSGNSALDGRTCNILRQDGRFRPAVDGDGQPVAAAILMIATWRISG